MKALQSFQMQFIRKTKNKRTNYEYGEKKDSSENKSKQNKTKITAAAPRCN